MNGFVALLRKEFFEIVQTWRIWVVPSLFIVFAISSPVSARFVNELLQSALPEGTDGASFVLPDPTWRDTLAQWQKNLWQIGIFVVLLNGGGMISSERRQGTQILVLTKPISRWTYVVAKFVSNAVFVAGTVLVAAVVEFVVSRFLFADSEAIPLLLLTATWLLYALVLLAVTLIGSATFDTPLAASGLGLGVMFVFAAGGLWDFASRYTPAGLNKIGSDLVAGNSIDHFGPVWSGIVAVAVLVYIAVYVFSRREL